MKPQFRKSAITTALACAGVFTFPGEVGAEVIPDGDYTVSILETPELVPGTGIPDTGCDTGGACANTSFTFGGLPSPSQSTGMFDNEGFNPCPSGPVGSSLFGDGLAGSFDITVSGEAFSVTNMQVDLIPRTAGANFVQYFPGDFAAMSGTIDQTTGAMTLTPTGRLGSTSSPLLCDNRWNVDDITTPGNTTWASFTTGTDSNSFGSVSGTPISNLGDINGDTLDDYHAVIATASQVGTDWGTFSSAGVIEVWSIDILSISPNLVDDADTVSEFTAKSIPVLDNDGGKPLLTITSTTDGLLGNVAIDAGATSVTYTSTGGLGADSFVYEVTDGDGNSDTATVNITVAGTIVVAVADSGATDQEQTVTIDVIANDSTSAVGETVDGSTVTVSATEFGAMVTDNNDGTVDYTPPAGYIGTDTFTYTVEDTAGNLSNDATVSVRVASAAVTSAGSYGPGDLAVSVGSTNGQITAGDIPVEDTRAQQSCVGGCYDFIITGATNPTTVVLPLLTESVPADAGYRKLRGVFWGDFDTSLTGDTVASAPLSAGGGCPGIDDASWSVWNGAAATAAQVGHVCLRLVIADNGTGAGPNDSDPTSGTIADPGGIGTFPAVNTSATDTLNNFDSGGCSAATGERSLTNAGDWWLLAGFIGLLGWTSSLRRHRGR